MWVSIFAVVLLSALAFFAQLGAAADESGTAHLAEAYAQGVAAGRQAEREDMLPSVGAAYRAGFNAGRNECARP